MISVLDAQDRFPHFKITSDRGGAYVRANDDDEPIAIILQSDDGTFVCTDASDVTRSGFNTLIAAIEWASSEFAAKDRAYFQPGETYRGMCGGPAPTGYDFAGICNSLAETLTEKNAKYGNSFAVSGDFLRLLWPNGCEPEDFDRVMLCARMFDKMKRLAAAQPGDDEDPLLDLAGYAVLGLATRKDTTP